ncbi:protein C1orf43 homolog [Battus philenor]|uniref:protein C1orf43 homolog n=1 Tax=Battus philenor TaxID=42288 RepID=UPI0035CEFD2E
MQAFTSIRNIIFIISGGVLTFVILFIFAKRQITRFALRSRRGPHVPIGTDAKKSLKKEIERRIEAVPWIVYEPRLLSAEPSHYILEPQQPYHYRFRAVDDVKTLEEEIARQDPGLRRRPRESLRSFLLSSLAAPLDGRGQKLVHQFCDTYECARHHPAEFGEDEYRAYGRLLLKLLDAARLLKSVGACSRTSPRDSPQRRPARLLDPARLRPTALAALPGANKLPAVLHNQYTALENMPVDSKMEDEIIRVPVKSPTEPLVKAPADETAV